MVCCGPSWLVAPLTPARAHQSPPPFSPPPPLSREFIESLPDTDGPDTFGLPRNIERTSQKTKSEIILRQLKSLEASGGGTGGGFDSARWKALLGPALDSWKRLAQNPAALDTDPGPALVSHVV